MFYNVIIVLYVPQKLPLQFSEKHILADDEFEALWDGKKLHRPLTEIQLSRNENTILKKADVQNILENGQKIDLDAEGLSSTEYLRY